MVQIRHGFLVIWKLTSPPAQVKNSIAMASSEGHTKSTFKRFKPHLLMTLVQVGYAPLYFLTEASFNHGLNPQIYITYRHIVAGMVMGPFACFLERKTRPKMTWALFLEIFILSLLGVGLTLNMFFTSLKFTPPIFLASAVNSIAALTFVIAVILGLEILDIRSARGMAKIAGTILSLAGVLTMTMYRGPRLRNLGHSLVHIQGGSFHEDWLKGSLLTIASCLAWSIWYIMQAYTLKRYPAQLSLTTWMSFLGAAQSAVYAAFVQNRPQAWTIGYDVDFWTIFYGGVVISGLVVFIQLWCIEERGPVFVTMFNPLTTITVAVLAYFALGEKLYMGSILGAVVVIIGLYLVLWGKDKDKEISINTKENGQLEGKWNDTAKKAGARDEEKAEH